MQIFRNKSLYYPQKQLLPPFCMRPSGTSSLLARDHAIFTRKIAGELIHIANFIIYYVIQEKRSGVD